MVYCMSVAHFDCPRLLRFLIFYKTENVGIESVFSYKVLELIAPDDIKAFIVHLFAMLVLV